MKLHRFLRDEFSAVFQTKTSPGMTDFTEIFSLLTNSEQKAVRNLHARAFRRAVRRARRNAIS